MSIGEVACCNDETTDQALADFNPKIHGTRVSHKKTTIFDWTNKRNPLLDQMRDINGIAKTFEKYPLIPFAGSSKGTGHALLKFLMSMYHLSTTHGACIVSQKKFAFGGKMDVTVNADPEFDFEEEEISIAEKKKYSAFIRTIQYNTANLKGLAENIFLSKKITGNAYVSLTRSETLGVKSTSINFYNPDTCLYLATEKGEDKIMVISDCFDFDYLTKHPPTLVPLYPNFVKKATGEEVTMFHLKDTTDWYGRPDSLSSFLYQYREFQDANYLIQECDNGFTGKVFIEIEDGDPETEDPDNPDSVDSVVEEFEKSFTNKGENPLSIMFMTRPQGAGQAFIHQFKPNTNEKFFEISSSISERKILISHSWSARLLGESKAAGLSTNLFTDELESKLPLLEGYQTDIENFLNIILQQACIYMGEETFATMGVKFRTPFNVIASATRDERAGKNMNQKSSTLTEEVEETEENE